jgi:hypothetical protein
MNNHHIQIAELFSVQKCHAKGQKLKLLKTFRFAAASLWNSLPDHFRTENSFTDFRSLVQSWTGSDCRCSACK